MAILGLAAGLCTGGGRLAAAELPVADLAEIEQLLSQLNFYPGKVDGVIDDQTRTAIRLYQEFAVLPVDGEPSVKLLTELRHVSQVYTEMHAAAPAAAEAAPAPEAAMPDSQVANAATAEVPPESPPVPESTPAQDTALPAEAAPEAEAESVQPLSPSTPGGEGAGADTPSTAAPASSPKVAILEAPAETAPPAEAQASAPAPVSAPVPPAADSAVTEPQAPEAHKDDPGKAAPAPAAPGKARSFSIESMIARLKQSGDPAKPAGPAPARATAPTAAPGQAAPDHVATDRTGYQRTMIWKAQNELKRIGLDPGPADGNARERTTRAIETYQRARGLPVDGQVSEELLARLESEAAPAAPAPGAAAPLGSIVPQAAAIDAPPQNGYQAFRAGYGAALAGNFEAAVKLYDQAIDSGDLALEHLAAALYNRANAFQYLGVLDKAIEDYSAAIANKPGFPAAYYNRGFAFDAKGEQIRAVEDFRKARDLGLQRLGIRSPDLPPPLL